MGYYYTRAQCQQNEFTAPEPFFNYYYLVFSTPFTWIREKQRGEAKTKQDRETHADLLHSSWNLHPGVGNWGLNLSFSNLLHMITSTYPDLLLTNVVIGCLYSAGSSQKDNRSACGATFMSFHLILDRRKEEETMRAQYCSRFPGAAFPCAYMPVPTPSSVTHGHPMW